MTAHRVGSVGEASARKRAALTMIAEVGRSVSGSISLACGVDHDGARTSAALNPSETPEWVSSW
jgi:hypothetical protein